MNKDIVDCGTIEALEKQLDTIEKECAQLKKEAKELNLELTKAKWDAETLAMEVEKYKLLYEEAIWNKIESKK